MLCPQLCIIYPVVEYNNVGGPIRAADVIIIYPAVEPWSYMNFIWITVVGVLVLVFVRTIYERVDGTGT